MKWIPLSERKPPICDRVLYATKYGDMFVGESNGTFAEHLTHWMEIKLPEPKYTLWEKLEFSFKNWNWNSHGKISTNEVLENMYYYLKDNHDRNE